ncbi:hypothetical protein TNCV_3920611 [Trichonephila clavipes]|nr:hypothetical protein TNCV_3920611 [Trichonephila clavipes]
MDGMQMYTVLSQEKTTSPYFQGVYSRDTLPPLEENMCAIVNSDDSSQPGTHCDMKDDINLYDTSDYDENNIYNLPLVNKKVIGKMKDENKGNIMTEYEKTIQLAPQLENQSQCRRKTTQLVSRNETTQQEKTTQLGNMNETTQQEKTTQLSSRNETIQLGSRNETIQLGSRNETTQLVSRNETTQLCTAVDRLHRLYSRIGFFYLLMVFVYLYNVLQEYNDRLQKRLDNLFESDCSLF